MNRETCSSISPMLVDYADGELGSSDAQRVAAHLAECSECLAELRVLERSLDLARDVWHESACGAPASGACLTRRNSSPVRVAACVAGVLLLAAAVGLCLLPGGKPDGRAERPEGPQPVADTTRSDSLPSDEGISDIEALIAREGRSARLAMAARLLAGQPGLKQYKQQAERYLFETYRGTTAVEGETTVPPPLAEGPKS